MRRLPLLLLTLPLLLATPAIAQPAAALTIEQVMADPDWIGPPVEQAWWGWNSQQVHYNLKRAGSLARDTYTQPISGAAAQQVGDGERSALDAADPVFDASRQRMAFVRNGDVFIRDLRNGTLSQVTRSNDNESQPRFAHDGGLTWRVGNQWYRRSADGRVSQAAQLLADGRPEVWDALIHRAEARLIHAALASTRGRRIEAAQRLGIGRNTITRKIQELGLDE